MRARGRFIVIEGGESSGKSTQAQRLADEIGAVLTREPGGTLVGEKIRALLLDDSLGALEARTELFLMLAARAQHVAEKIRPMLTQGRDVVCDRFNGSTLAYQGFGRGLPLEDVEIACVLASEDVQPDLVILLEVSSDIAHSRRGRALDRIESAGEQFHAKVAAGFLALAKADPDKWAVVDADGSRDAVFERILGVVHARLGTSTEQVSPK